MSDDLKTGVPDFSGWSCPLPLVGYPAIVMGHGGGGKLGNELVEHLFLPAFRNPELENLGDAAVLELDGGRLAMSTDSFVVQPLFFPGGSIGELAVNGTVNDLAVSGAITDAKGDRKKRPSQQEDRDVFLHLVEKRDDGIVVRGYKVSQSGAIGAHETLVLPGGGLKDDEGIFALAFAVPNGSPGITYICQYNAYSAEREMFGDDIEELGNPIYGQRETSTMVFDNVFIPWERVFLCGETKYAGRMVTRFAKAHRMNCGGACKVGFADVIIGGTMLAAEYIGVEKVPHIQEKIIDMVRLSETSHACAIAAAMRGREEPKGSGVYLPDDLFGNAAKLNIAHGFWEIIKNAGDIGGGLVVTMPRLKDLEDPEVGPVLKKVFGAAAPAEKRLKVAKFLQHWAAGLHGVGTWHGAGAPQTQRFMFTVLTDFEKKKKMAKKLMGMKED